MNRSGQTGQNAGYTTKKQLVYQVANLTVEAGSASMVATLMRKSREVPVTILAAIALFTAGCHDRPESRNCVDEQGRLVPDANCQTSSSGAHYRYLYGGASGGHYGDRVVGGSSTPSESGVARGGFGHAGGGEGGGE